LVVSTKSAVWCVYTDAGLYLMMTMLFLPPPVDKFRKGGMRRFPAEKLLTQSFAS